MQSCFAKLPPGSEDIEELIRRASAPRPPPEERPLGELMAAWIAGVGLKRGGVETYNAGELYRYFGWWCGTQGYATPKVIPQVFGTLLKEAGFAHNKRGTAGCRYLLLEESAVRFKQWREEYPPPPPGTGEFSKILAVQRPPRAPRPKKVVQPKVVTSKERTDEDVVDYEE